MSNIQLLALIITLCGNPNKTNLCIHNTLDCFQSIKEKYENKVIAVRYCVKNQPINPNRIKDIKWK